MDAVNRIFDLLKQQKMDQKKFAEKIGVRPQAITEWKKGVTSSYTKRLPKIAEVLNTTVEYLLSGNEDAKSLDTTLGVETPSENELIFRSLPPERQEEVLRYMRYLVAQEQEKKAMAEKKEGVGEPAGE